LVITELIERDRLPALFIAGFSLGGNMVLKCAGEYGDEPPPQLLGVCAISPSVDPAASVCRHHAALQTGSITDFVRRLQ